MRLEVPEDAAVDSDLLSGLSVYLHPVQPPPFELRDTRFTLVLHVSRKSDAEVDQEMTWLRESKPRTRETEWHYWMAERHPKLDVLDRTEYTYYRYDLACRDGTILQAKAEVQHDMPEGVRAYWNEDDRTIRRMLMSLRCLDRPKR